MKNQDMVTITKASGRSEPFSSVKLQRSLARSGADEKKIADIIHEIGGRLYEGISTKEIYKIAFSLLKGSASHLAAKYHLKQAIMELGPSGFPFEKYIGEILHAQGYKTTVGVIVQGSCVKHEIDVIAEKDNRHFMIECKYHNEAGTFSGVKIPLYIQARFKDVEAQWLKLPGHGTQFHQGWVVTNTRFSSDAIQYGTCAGLRLLGWDYPLKGSLKEQIDTLGLYPITCMTTLSKIEKQRLLDKKIVLCKEVRDHEEYLLQAGVNPSRIKSIIAEAAELCKDIVQDEQKEV